MIGEWSICHWFQIPKGLPDDSVSFSLYANVCSTLIFNDDSTGKYIEPSAAPQLFEWKLLKDTLRIITNDKGTFIFRLKYKSSKAPHCKSILFRNALQNDKYKNSFIGSSSNLSFIKCVQDNSCSLHIVKHPAVIKAIRKDRDEHGIIKRQTQILSGYISAEDTIYYRAGEKECLLDTMSNSVDKISFVYLVSTSAKFPARAEINVLKIDYSTIEQGALEWLYMFSFPFKQ